MTGIADTLERKGMVGRCPSTDEARCCGEMFGGCCCELLPPEESRELSRLLAKLADALPF